MAVGLLPAARTARVASPLLLQRKERQRNKKACGLPLPRRLAADADGADGVTAKKDAVAQKSRNLAEMTPNERFLRPSQPPPNYRPVNALVDGLFSKRPFSTREKTVHLASSQPDSAFHLPPGRLPPGHVSGLRARLPPEPSARIAAGPVARPHIKFCRPLLGNKPVNAQRAARGEASQKYTPPLAEATILSRPQRPGRYLQTRGQGRAHTLMCGRAAGPAAIRAEDSGGKRAREPDTWPAPAARRQAKRGIWLR